MTKSVNEVLNFHGLVSCYQQFITVHYSSIMMPIRDCVKVGKMEAATDALHQIKQKITTTPVLSLLDFSQPFELLCDASKIGIGVVLS